ncbi:MAG TPA: hydrogenase expression/formation protein HypE [Vicinamibacterales bacterium]|nr:hydrogenase expression/formation protein HypE [Vicinamibacterales bacterium]HPK72618.1 hydrogenase expression/formation protein HypE [Vicinamibacterales bacterium]
MSRVDGPGARIGLTHGAGGRAMRALIEQVCLAGLGAGALDDGIGLQALDDGAAVRAGSGWMILTTDSHVVKPIFFPGGDIGRLAVCGTVNDLAVMGATERPILTCAVIVEEGFPRDDLERVYLSIRTACEEAGAAVAAGDTKVMGRGELDGLVLNTAGVAFCDRPVPDAGLSPGDRILVTGPVGDHGMAVVVARHALALEGDLRSDVAPVNGLVRAALAAGGTSVTAMKDPTRSGTSGALHEMARKSRVGIVIDERSVPVRPSVRSAAGLLGLDPLVMACEGRAVIGVSADRADAVLDALRAHPLGRGAACIGRCIGAHAGAVILDTGVGRRLLAEPEGEPLPRIC